MGRRALLLPASLALTAVLARPPLADASDWPQWNLDSRHSGTSLQESTLHAGNVATLHVRYHVTLPDVADGAPAYLAGVLTPQGQKDLLFLNTRGGTLLAVDAATGAVVWSKQPATGPGATTSSPAVDPSRRFVYAYALDGKVHKYAVGDGAEVTTGGWPEVATLKPDVEKGSAALSLATAANGTSYLYAASSGYKAETGDYQGHVSAIV
ncbi:MAG: PQQ-binding-like beta-propeller repeat protein, partial [Acidobacteriota bacterium]|nr:PQQ-binding-like beta-propeller repeat protein [Acidobacteriota bacterium]